MQLLLLLLLAMSGGNMEALKKVKPVLEGLGDGEIMQTIEKVEEISSMLSAVQTMAGSMGTGSGAPSNGARPDIASPSGNNCFGGADESGGNGFPLAPVSNIADENITYCLSRYVATGE